MFDKRGPLGPQSMSLDTQLWRACNIYIIYSDIMPVPGTMYIMYIKEEGTRVKFVHNYICTTQTGMGRVLPHFIYGEQHYLQYLHG